jgi:hypothetical protein
VKAHSAWKIAVFNAAMLGLMVLPTSLIVASLLRHSLARSSATVPQVLEGAVFAFLILVLPYTVLSAAHSAVMYLLRRHSEKWSRLFVASTWLAVLALPLIAEVMRTDQRSGRYDLAHLLAIGSYCLLARAPK